MAKKWWIRSFVCFIPAAALLVANCSEEYIVKKLPFTPDTLMVPVEPPVTSDVVINEVCVGNSSTITDQFGNDPDWIELYNRGDTAINLKGYALSDDSTNHMLWQFGNVTIDPGSYLLVFASGKDIPEKDARFPDDTVNIKDATRWSDAMGSGGKSTISKYEYSSLWPVDSQGYRLISATMDLVDNRPALDWSSCNFSTVFSRQDEGLGTDYSMYSSIDLKLTLEKGRGLGIRFIQKSLPEWKGYMVRLEGTGISDDHYTIAIQQAKGGLDLKNLTGFYIQAPENEYGKTSFTLKRITFRANAGYLHASFKLSGNEGVLRLSSPDTTPLHAVALTPLPDNITSGFSGDAWTILSRATPEAANVDEAYSGVLPPPVAVTEGGFYAEPVTVVLSAGDSGKIYYTVNGSIPDTSATEYEGPIKIEKTTALRYRVYSKSMVPSEVRTETYFIDEVQNLPVVSLVVDSGAMFDNDTGLYMKGPNAADSFPYFGANFWSDKELPAVIELYERDGKRAFSTGAGVSMSGNWSKGADKKSLAIDFREVYGMSELDYRLFMSHSSEHKYKKVVLRGNGGTGRESFIDDAMMQSLLDDLDVDHQKSRPAVLYINGRYFGLHHLKEPSNHDYVYSNYGLQKEEIDFFDRGFMMKWGTPDLWNDLTQLLTSDVGSNAEKVLGDSVYARVRKEIDIGSYIDYNAHQIYIDNTDWPANNCRYWRSRDKDGLWRWITYDLDAGFGAFGCAPGAGKVSFNTMAFAVDETAGADVYPNGLQYTFLLRALLRNAGFKAAFINRFVTLLYSDFSAERVTARIDSAAQEIIQEVPADGKRWGYTQETWLEDVDKLKLFAGKRCAYVFDHIKEQFSLDTVYSLTIPKDADKVTVNGLPLREDSFTGRYFTGVPLSLEVKKSEGSFLRWSDGSTDNPRMFDAARDTAITPLFGD